MLRSFLAALALVGCAHGAARAPSAAGPDGAETPLSGAESLTPEGAPIGLRKSAIADEWFWLRTKLLDGDGGGPLRETVGAMSDLRAELSTDSGAWEDLEVALGSAGTSAQLIQAYARLPERQLASGRSVALRASALRAARAMQRTERAYREGPYKEHEGAIARAADELKARLLAREPEIVAALRREMLVSEIPPLVITLVGEAPYPAMFAADSSGTNIAMFVRVRGLEGSALVETVLGEALHAVDEISVKTPSAMNAVRAAIADRFASASDANVEMAVNTITFAEAASLVRRFVDPAHRSLGEGGFYTLYPPAPAIVEAWERYLAGAPLEATAAAIATAVEGGS